ncbi:hypothetical protein [Okeania sp. KiyG1]|uniref:hypothetical protein n=1 Tax=Okeania sp. KiyG1 TaxID=2720165 RepID=UPI001922A9CD|nr:hypothetical protein [Okeania sp. KiyG1]GGA54448.1 hypothetical protein CYANOKiyG1_74770 [Okeania sp. KiyG1]
MQNQNTGFNLEVTKVRPLFADRLQGMAEIIAQSEQQAKNKGASGELALSAFINDLDKEIERLKMENFAS